MRVDLIPGEPQGTIKCSQHDTKLRKFEFTLYKDDEVYIPSGECSLVVKDTKYPLTLEGENLYCDCTEDMTSESGIFDCKIRIAENDEVLYSALFKMKVEARP